MVSTTRPPTKPTTYFIYGALAMALIAVLALGIYMFTGSLVTSGQLRAAETDLEAARTQIESLESGKRELEAQNRKLQDEIQASQELHSQRINDLNRQLEENREALHTYRKEEEKVEFTARRATVDLQGLASAIHQIEGVQVKILDSGLLISGVASPFRLGSSRIEDDALIGKLGEIAAVLQRRKQETGTTFYAAAVGNTDVTPVREGSLWGSNLWLGAHRARTLADRMIENGFSREEVFLVSWGTIQATGATHDPESRRPEIFVVTGDFFQKVKDSRPDEN